MHANDSTVDSSSSIGRQLQAVASLLHSGCGARWGRMKARMGKTPAGGEKGVMLLAGMDVADRGKRTKRDRSARQGYGKTTMQPALYCILVPDNLGCVCRVKP
jgi:hypothetical protein